MARQRSADTAPMFKMDALECRRLLSSYVVAPSGSDSNPGTSASPWATLQHAADSVVAGDSVSVRAGTYAGFVIGWNEPQNGTASKPITFKADAGAIITTRNAKTADGINLEGTDYVIVDGFTIQPASEQGNFRAGIRSVQNSHVIVRNNSVKMRSTDRYGIFSSFTTSLLVQKNDVSGTNNSGIYTSNSAEDPIIRGNRVHNVGGNGLHFNGDISQGGTGMIDGAIVEQNIIFEAGGAAGGSAINMDGVRNSRIHNNVLYNNRAKGIALYQIDAASGSTNNQILHNTVVMPADATGYALTIKDGSTGNLVFNNILLSAASFNGSISIAPDSASGFQSDYNIVTPRLSVDGGDTNLTLGEWKSQTSQDSHSTAPDPFSLVVDLTNNDLRLKAGSSAIDAATGSHSVSNDIAATARPSGAAADIGAYEFVSPSATKPNAPTGVKAKAASPTSVGLTWNDIATNETGYLIRAKMGPHGAWFTVARRGVNSHSYTIKGLTSGQKYYFRVRAFNANGSSQYAPYAAATLPINPAQARVRLSLALDELS